jgi:hypothetical protein
MRNTVDPDFGCHIPGIRFNSYHVGFGRFGDGVMATSLGIPKPDCNARGARARVRRAALEALALHRSHGVTTANGEELRFGAGRMANFHKTLPHDLVGRVHAASYHAMVAALTIGDDGALETLPIGANRSKDGPFDDTNPEQFADYPGGVPGPTLRHRIQTSLKGEARC